MCFENPLLCEGFRKAFSYGQEKNSSRTIKPGLVNRLRTKGAPKLDNKSLAHTTWNCKYHIVFAPKYRRQIIHGQIKADVGKILRQLCERKGVEIIEGIWPYPDHIHMLVSIPPKLSVSSFVGYLKGKSSLMIFDRHANLKYRYGNRKFWCRGYYVDTVGRNKKIIQEYIKNQLQEDILEDQMTMKEFIDPFTGEEIKKKEKINKPL